MEYMLQESRRGYHLEEGWESTRKEQGAREGCGKDKRILTGRAVGMTSLRRFLFGSDPHKTDEGLSC